MQKRFFWVNHKQTGKQERENSYIWAPKTKSNGAQNIPYDNLLKVRKGDIIFSYSTLIQAYGIAQGPAYSNPKPKEFGKAGEVWNDDGWKVDVKFHPVTNKIKPSEYIDQLAPLLNAKYYPISPKTGYGIQSCYLAEISCDLALLLFSLTESEHFADTVICNDIIAEQEELKRMEKELEHDKETDVKRMLSARIGQGDFRKGVIQLEPICRVTKIRDTAFLKASHIKPWRDSNKTEKLDPHNGLMLAPHVDHLFDQGWISFTNKGDILVSQQLKPEIFQQLGLKKCNVGSFSEKTTKYLAWHRENIYKK
ncbi:HNH endonuclease [Pragia fontium]|uniref:HNH endonuclease n=1 Tax=Pragia fontium DSM 5563 = ATCC 49100 TaxID=1122977 RepID=A0AAJ4W7D5_9GAMM|nr:HNH endonuclease [Pragia fontium]SFB96084.1 HNH endonuclease [Pragia fontium DSM 5563 = ATCC 49100]